ncbi:MAG: 3-keto-5-aminohexanoate cleavage protein [Proteobacteria bacterium]|nr:3-keto-5-aminohexanoate cleavage protein [Pseudomonadota bacterium]
MIISAPNGARRTTADHPALPVTPGQLADTAAELVEQQVSVLHLHVRDQNQQHTLDVDSYRAAISAIRSRVGARLIIQVTTEAVGLYTPDQQMDVIKALRPEAVSLSLSELCPDEAAQESAANFFHWLVQENIWPQFILYSPGDLLRFDELRKNGVLAKDHPFCLFVLGHYADQTAGDTSDLDAFMATVDCTVFPWAVCCFGGKENEVMVAATGRGGHVRIGFENNLCLTDGREAKNNGELIVQYTRSSKDSNRKPASADEVREAFGLS